MNPRTKSLVSFRKLLGVTVVVAFHSPLMVLAQGTVTGNAWVEEVKGRPGSYIGLYEWNIHTVIDGGTAWGHQFRVGLPPQTNRAYYVFPNPEINTPLPGGVYSMILDKPLVWGRPQVATYVPFPSSGTFHLNVEPATDYSCTCDDNYPMWGHDPWDWDSAFYQTFVATGTSITGISFRMAGTTADSVRMSIHQDNGGAVDTWPQVGIARTRPTEVRSDIWVRFRSGEIPTVPGQRYALRLEGIGGGGGLGIFRRIDSGDGYALGQAFSSSGTPRNYDLFAVIFSDNDGTVVSYVSRSTDGAQELHWEWAWSQEIRAKGTSLAGAVMYFASIPWSAPLRFRVRSGSFDGPQVGPAKVGPGAAEASNSAFAAASWNPGEVPLIPGQIYYLEVSGVPGSSSHGLTAYGFSTAENVYPDGDAFANGVRQPGVDLYMHVVEYANVIPPTMVRNPASFTPQAARGNNAPSDTFTVANGGGGVLHYWIEEDIPWSSVSPAEGSTTGPPISHTIQYTTAGLKTGSYNGVITLSAPAATNPTETITVNLTVTPPPYAFADFDKDGDVDQEDFAHFQRCVSGTGNPPTSACLNADLDGDGDVDQADFNIFFGCLAGANLPPPAECTNQF
jgi:hypothetical protein